MACKYEHNGKLYTAEQLANHPDFRKPFAAQEIEREHVLNNTGVTSNWQLFPTTGDPEAIIGVFAKYVKFKEEQLLIYEEKLSNVKAAKKRKENTAAELSRLTKLERELKKQIEGNTELKQVGLKQEIDSLKRQGNINAVGPYVEKDLRRLEKLANSSDVHDLQEAKRLIDFYDQAGTFRTGVENPFFSQDEIFLADNNGKLSTEYRLDEDTMNQFKKWRDDAAVFNNVLDKRHREVGEDTVNQDSSVAATYGKDKKFSYDEIVNSDNGLKDTDWLSMWTMDVTQGIFSHNGIIPQVMFSHLANSLEKKLKWARDVEEKIDKMKPGVEKALIRLGQTLRGGGIIGLKGVSYQIFKEITKEGNETGGLIRRWVKEYFDAQASVMNEYYSKRREALGYTDYDVKRVAMNRAFEKLKGWRRLNNIIVDINKIPELLPASTPEAEAHKRELMNLLGKEGYDDILTEQRMHLMKYESDREGVVEDLLLRENVTKESDLSADAKSTISFWETNHDPKRGIEDYYSVPGLSYGNYKTNNTMEYNVFVPRKFRTTITANNQTNQYDFTDTNVETGHYNKDFTKIEQDPALNEYYQVIKEVAEKIREHMPYELQKKMAANSIPSLLKNFAEILADKNVGPLSSLFKAFKYLYEKLRVSFGVIKQSEICYAVIDPTTDRANYKVNDQFLRGNIRAISEMETVERIKFLQAYNKTQPSDAKVGKIGRFTTLALAKMNAPTLSLLADYLQIDISYADIQAGRIDKIKAKTGEMVSIGKYIKDYSTHSVVQSQSFDLSKIAKYYSNLVMAYAARQEALPILEIMKKHYEGIKQPATTNIGAGKKSIDDDMLKYGIRTRGIEQMDDWFERVVLDNYSTKHTGLHGDTKKSRAKAAKREARIQEIEKRLAQTSLSQSERDRLTAEKERLLIKKAIPHTFGKDIHTKEEKKKIGEIEALLRDETDEKKRAELIKIREGLGRVRTGTALFDNILAWIRTMRLGYNLSSATTNFLEGVTSNMILASMGNYFDPKEMYYGYGVVKHSFVKNLSFGLIETDQGRKNRRLMDRFNVIMDSKNELQKSSTKTYASKFSWLNPYEVNQRVEFINQSPVMIAMLRTVKITDKEGNESSVWDAMDRDGKLKDEFKTEENIENWENLSGEQYLNFKQKLHKAIVIGHGNYDDLRGMMAKSNSTGKALMMFKTWLPMQFYQRFAVEQDDIQSNNKGFRGRYYSYGRGSGMTHLGVVGGAAFGLPGLVGGLSLGYLIGRFKGTDTDMNALRELVETTKHLFMKALGAPVNAISGLAFGKRLIGTDKAFDNWVGKGDFTAQDARNMRGNMADLVLQLAWIAMMLLVKGWYYDDDEKIKKYLKSIEDADQKRKMEEEFNRRKKKHNILVNTFMQLSSQAAQYVNPVDTYKSAIGSNGMIQYFESIGKWLVAVDGYMNDEDIIQSGVNAGESKLANETKRTFIPGLFKDLDFTLGFGSKADRQFEKTPFDRLFKSDAKLDKESNRRDRAERRNELEESGLDNKEILKILNEELPTPKQLEKQGVTREEYEDAHPKKDEEDTDTSQ